MGLCPRSLRQLLEGLCHSTPWEYAIFWKLNRRGCMMLTWEEGYWKTSKMSNPPRNKEFDEFSYPPSSANDIDARNIQAQYPIGLEISRMSSNLYSLGNGIVGNVAFTGKYQLLSFSGLNSKVLPEYPDEWQHQFGAGIKTILLVPVGSHGVVQLGSYQLVEEDMMFVADIKDLFNSFYDNSGGFTDITSDGDDLRTYTKSCLLKNNEIRGDIEQASRNELITGYCNVPLPSEIKESSFLQADEQNMSGMDMHLPDGSSWDAIYNFSPMVPTQESFYQDGCFGFNDSFFIECKSSNLTAEDILFTSSQCNNDDSNLFTGLPSLLNSCNSEVKHEQYGSHHNADEMDKPIIAEVLEITSNEINSDASDICTQSLKADIIYEHDNYVPNSTLGDYWLSSPAYCDSSVPEVDKVLVNEADVKRVIDSLLAELYNASNEGAPNTSRTERSSGDCSGEQISCCQAQRKCQSDETSMDNLVSNRHANPGVSSGSGIAHTSSPTGSSSSMNDSTLINEEKPHQTDFRTDKYKPNKSVPVGKKRPKPDENQRPRPRDRQLIQDRVKELRDLVPNGKKCSIDALLDRTIKHMMFLRSVSSQAEKLRKCSRSKVLGLDREPLEFEDKNYGLTWAYEVDSQPEACPIVVKDLDQQGHMLVEMLCTEYGDFLEIAQVMRRLHLTILKGVMESRAEKLWAHFVVEATKGFNRMEILWPLMQLLQQNRIPLTSRF